MKLKLSQLIDQISNFLAPRKGLLPLIGIAFILVNFLFQIIPLGWVSSSHLFLHFGLILSIIGLMLYWVL
ncbi:MAG: hypothetical protein JEZ00_00285 [Anaerolineaceae bacterium]|nr:hypothetical protein [Anaerolineaceae bacterium]